MDSARAGADKVPHDGRSAGGRDGYPRVDVSATPERHVDSRPELAVHAQATYVHADSAEGGALAALGRQRGPDDRRVPARIEPYVELDVILSG